MKKELMLDFLVSKCREDDEWEKRFKPQFVHFDQTSDAQKLREIKKKKREKRRKKEYENNRKMHSIKKNASNCSLESIISDEYNLSLPMQLRQNKRMPNISTSALGVRIPPQEMHKYLLYEQAPNTWQPPPSSELVSSHTPPSSQQSVPPAPPLPPFPLVDSSCPSSSFCSKIRSVKPKFQDHRTNDFDHMPSQDTTPNTDSNEAYNKYGVFDKNFSFNNSNFFFDYEVHADSNNPCENSFRNVSNLSGSTATHNLAHTPTSECKFSSKDLSIQMNAFVSRSLTEKNNLSEWNMPKKQKIFKEIKSLKLFNLLKLTKVKAFLESLMTTLTKAETTEYCGNISNSSSNRVSYKHSARSTATNNQKTSTATLSLAQESISKRETTENSVMSSDKPVDNCEIQNVKEKVLNEFSIIKIKNKNNYEGCLPRSCQRMAKYRKNMNKQEKFNKKREEGTVDNEVQHTDQYINDSALKLMESIKKAKQNKKNIKYKDEEKIKEKKTDRIETESQQPDEESSEDSEENTEELETRRRAEEIKNSDFEKSRTNYEFVKVSWNKDKPKNISSATTNDMLSYSRSSSDLTSIWSEEKVENPLKRRMPKRTYSFNQEFSLPSSYETTLESVAKLDVEAIKKSITRETVQADYPIIATNLEVKESSSHKIKEKKKKKNKSSKIKELEDEKPLQLKTSFANKADILSSKKCNTNMAELNEDEKNSTKSSTKAEMLSDCSSKKRIERFLDNSVKDDTSKIFSDKSFKSDKPPSTTESSGYPETQLIKNLVFTNVKRSKKRSNADETLIQQRRTEMLQEKESFDPKKNKKIFKSNIKNSKSKKKEHKNSKEKKRKS